jgi:energy-coupling factor transporter ATP-binding protein EcfA2
MSAPEEILAFSRTRDTWQQDVIRRLFTQGDFSERDLQDAVSMLKAQYGLVNGTPPKPLPLSEVHVPRLATVDTKVLLNSLGNLVNANRLATGQTLSFAVDGLTIIYGENGSGKTGYCRVLKKLCRVREGAEEEIRGNAFDPKSLISSAEATVRFTVGDGEPTEIRWKNGVAPPPELTRVSVFDAMSASLYADQQNKIEFLPQSLDILTQLGAVCERLARALVGERTQIEQRLEINLAEVSTGTEAAAVLGKLVKGTLAQDLPTKEAIEAACEWTAAQSAELEAVERELLSDPEALALKCRRVTQAVATLDNELTIATSKLDDASRQRCRALSKAAKTARDAATLAAADATLGDLLPGFASEAWRSLFAHARTYSTTAYPGETFPVTREGARCVLCQQPIGSDAAARFARFDRHVQGLAEADAVKKERDRDVARAEIERLLVRSPADAEALLVALGDDDPDAWAVVDAVGSYVVALDQRRHTMVRAFESGDWQGVPPLAETPNLAVVRQRLEASLAAHEAARDPSARRALEERVQTLRAQKIVSAFTPAMLARRDDLDTLSRIEACRRACDTTAISRKNSELRKRYLTKEFEERLFTEIRDLDIGDLPFRIQDRSERGASYLGIGLDSVTKVRNKEVLSGGEFRALAIACFLTEVHSISGHKGIIIDDPVSSLDNQRTRKVARRLVREAKTRQVIVFTHDLVFFHELRLAAAEQTVPVLSHWIRRTTEYGHGTIFQGEEPWGAKRVKTRLGNLEQKLAAIKKEADPGSDACRERVKSFYTDLRETWERLVEELLLGGVVERFQLGVETLSLKQVRVDDDDYRRVFFGMKRASEYSGHDRAVGAQAILPGKDEIAKDLADLRAYADQLRARNRQLQEDRKRLEEPPRGATL